MASAFCFSGPLVQQKGGDGIKTPISWVGNKTSILKILYALFPLEYGRYIEPFGGSGAVLLGKPKADKFEVYNDYNGNLVNLFRCIKDRPMALINHLGFLTLNAREDFDAIRSFFFDEKFHDDFLEQEEKLTKIMLPEAEGKELADLFKKRAKDHDVRRAAMYLKLLRYSYSSAGTSFAAQPFTVTKLFDLINQVSRRLNSTIIENQDFERVIKHYDRPDAFFYCDPPYLDSEHFYDVGFAWEDHVRLRNALMECKGKWLLSYNDCPEIRALYDGYQMFAFARIHSMAQRYDPGAEYHELLIANYDIYERERNLESEKAVQLSLLDMHDGETDHDLEKALRQRLFPDKKKEECRDDEENENI